MGVDRRGRLPKDAFIAQAGARAGETGAPGTDLHPREGEGPMKL